MVKDNEIISTGHMYREENQLAYGLVNLRVSSSGEDLWENSLPPSLYNPWFNDLPNEGEEDHHLVP